MYQSQSKGKAAEILFELLCMKKQWHCCKPIADFMHYDYIVDFGDGVFKKIQVKTVFYDKKTKQHRCDLRKNKNGTKNKEKYSQGDFDIVAISVEINSWLLIPWDSIKSNTEIKLSDKRIKNEPIWTVSFDL